MQTQSLQNTLLNTAAPSGQKSTANAGDTDFKHALARQVERQPAPAPAPVVKQAAPVKVNVPQTQSAPAPKTPQAPNSPPKAPAQAKAAQPANGANAANATAATNAAQGAEKTEGAATSAATGAAAETAETAPAATDAAAEATPVSDAAMAAAAAAVDPMAAMLAMVAAYNQLSNPAAAAPEAAGAETTGAATEGDPLAALQGDGEDGGKHGKGMGADPAALRAGTGASKGQLAGDGVPVNAGKPELTAGAVQTGIKAEAFAAKLAEASAEAPAVLPQATQALVATAQAADVAASNSLQARVGSNAWEQQLGQKVVWMVAGGDQTASLTLNPPDLGPMQVVLSVSNEQTSVSFMAAEPETRQALEDALPKLRETMSEAGIELGSATVSTGTQDQRQAFAEQAEARAAAAAGRGNHRAGNGVDEPTPAEPVVRRTVLGAVDTFA